MNAKKIISIITASAIITAAGLSTTAIKEENNLLISSAALSYENPELAEYAKQVAILVNRERSSYGLQPVKYSPLLSEAANVRSSELRKNFSHTRPNGTSCFTVLRASLKTPFEKKQLCTSSASSTSLGVRQHAFGRFPCSCRTYLFFL